MGSWVLGLAAVYLQKAVGSIPSMRGKQTFRQREVII